jgi:hypothetical protein
LNGDAVDLGLGVLGVRGHLHRGYRVD